MKVIDLLNKIANRKDMPLSFRYEGIIWVLRGGKYYQKVNDNIEFEIWFEGLLFKYLNDEIELIEEDKKIEKLESHVISQNYVIADENAPMKERMELVRKLIYSNSEETNIVKNKINELIDEVNKLKEE